MMEKYFFRTIVCVVSLIGCVFLSACHSYNDREWKTVDFASTPEGATIFINGKNCGLTPRTERLACRSSYDVRFSLPGYFDEDFVLESFPGKNGRPDIVDRLEASLVKISPETLALREGLKKGENLPKKVLPSNVEKKEGEMSATATAFLARGKPTDFTDFRLREKMLKRLLAGEEITEEEYRSLHEKLYRLYNENRLLKAPRLGTYEKAP